MSKRKSQARDLQRQEWGPDRLVCPQKHHGSSHGTDVTFPRTTFLQLRSSRTMAGRLLLSYKEMNLECITVFSTDYDFSTK